MRILDLKNFFMSDYRYNWESEEFLRLSIKLLEETKNHKFFNSSPSNGKRYENLLSEFTKKDN